MKRVLVLLVAGLMFGAGLALAGMTLPQRVLGFLDVAGAWDPALVFVLGGAVITAGVGYYGVFRRAHPILDQRFHLAGEGGVDAALLGGSALFGIGWGISGYCPGPAVALLAVPGNRETVIFLGSLLVGMLLAGLVSHWRAMADID